MEDELAYYEENFVKSDDEIFVPHDNFLWYALKTALTLWTEHEKKYRKETFGNERFAQGPGDLITLVYGERLLAEIEERFEKN